MFFGCVYFLSLSLMGQDGEVDKGTLLGLLETAYAPLQSVALEYEGSLTYPQKPNIAFVDKDGLFDLYSGRFVERRDGALLVDIYHRYHSDKHAITRETLSMIDGKFENYTRKIDEKGGAGEIQNSHFMRPNVIGSVVKLISCNMLIGILKNDDWALIQEGTEDVDGHSCLVATLVYKMEKSTREKFWIDLERGGHALRRESIRENNVAAKLFKVSLEQFVDAKGSRVWLPTFGICEAYGTVGASGKAVFGSDATNRETYTVLQESVRINTDIKDDEFGVKYRSGTLVSDKLRRLQFEFGQTGRLKSNARKPDDLVEGLKEQIKTAEKQATELEAASWERSSTSWSEWWPWVGAGCAAILLSTVLVITRRGRQS